MQPQVQPTPEAASDLQLAIGLHESLPQRTRSEKLIESEITESAHRFRTELRELEKEPLVRKIMQELVLKGFTLHLVDAPTDQTLGNGNPEMALGLSGRSGFVLVRPAVVMNDKESGRQVKQLGSEEISIPDGSFGILTVFREALYARAGQYAPSNLPNSHLALFLADTESVLAQIRQSLRSFASNLIEGHVSSRQGANGEKIWIMPHQAE